VSGQRLDRSWWDSPTLRPVLARRDIGGLYRWLQRHGWSQTQIGAATCQSQGEVSEILAGRQVRAYDVLARIADAFEIPRGLMGLAYGLTDGEQAIQDVDEDDPAQRRGFLGAVASVSVGAMTEQARRWLPAPVHAVAPVPEHIGHSDVEQVWSTTAELRRLDQRYGGGAAVDAARGLYGWAHGMLHSTADDATRTELKVALADLSSLVGWAFHDAGKQQAARRYLMNALVLARDADENALVASVLYRLGRVSLHQHNPVDALRLLQLGQIAAQEARNAAELARLHTNEAWAYAMMGQEHQVLDSLARARFELSRLDPSTSAPWVATFLIEGGFTGNEALIYSTLAGGVSEVAESRRCAARAAELAATALACSGSERPVRSQIFDRIILATNQLRIGEIEVGLGIAHSAVNDAQTLKSARAMQRLDEIAIAASIHAAKNSDALHLRECIATISRPSTVP
jgi:transcriptional regulator with XRE-family HTH domain